MDAFHKSCRPYFGTALSCPVVGRRLRWRRAGRGLVRCLVGGRAAQQGARTTRPMLALQPPTCLNLLQLNFGSSFEQAYRLGRRETASDS